jgi:transposase
LSWQGTARQYGLNWKSVATIVKRAVAYGLRHRARPPVRVIGIDEVSRRKGQVYLTVVYDLERRVLLWVGDDRTEEAVRPFFTKEMGTRRCHTLRVICMDMWAAYANLVKEHAPQAQILFDRFHIVKHLNEAVEEVRVRNDGQGATSGRRIGSEFGCGPGSQRRQIADHHLWSPSGRC